MKTVKVVAAIVIQNDQVLLARRPPGTHHGLLWEFPGGKVESGESPEAALIRELREELNWDVEVGELFDVFTYDGEDVITEISFYLVSRARVVLHCHGRAGNYLGKQPNY